MKKHRHINNRVDVVIYQYHRRVPAFLCYNTSILTFYASKVSCLTRKVVQHLLSSFTSLFVNLTEKWEEGGKREIIVK